MNLTEVKSILGRISAFVIVVTPLINGGHFEISVEAV